MIGVPRYTNSTENIDFIYARQINSRNLITGHQTKNVKEASTHTFH